MKEHFPDIFQYQCFREYLKAVFEFKKKNSKNFSLRMLAKEMGLSTHAHFFDVMYGRSLTDKFLPKYVEWLQLNEKQRRYLVALVTYDQAQRESERRAAFHEMVRLSPHLETLQMDARYVKFFDKWYQPVLMVMLTLYPKEKNPEILARLFQPRIKTNEVEDALDLMREYKLISWDEQKGEWVLEKHFLKSEDTTRKMALKPYHRKMQELGIYHYDNHYDEQQFASMTLATTSETLQKVREIIKKCREDIVNTVRQDPREEILVQVNMQTFEIVRKRK